MKRSIALATIVTITMANAGGAYAWPFKKDIRQIVMTGGNGGVTPDGEEPATEAKPPSIYESGEKSGQPAGVRKTPLLKGQVTYVVPAGTGIKLKLSSVPMTGLKMLDRDMDGNLPPAQLGQKITAKTTEDMYVADNKVIPAGTIFYGEVSKIFAPKRVGRPGSLALGFTRFKTPDGRVFAFHVEANNTRASTVKSKLKGAGIVAANTAGGAALGCLIAYQLFGLQDTIAMHGYNLAGGAALGALGGMAYALLRHGSVAVLEPGDDLNLTIDSDLLLPAAVEPKKKTEDPHLEGFQMQVLKSKMLKDGLDGNQLRIDALIENNSDVRLKSIDLFLEDDNNNRFPIVTSNDEESEYLFDIAPHSMQQIRFNFQVDYPKLKRKLVWLDHESRQVIIKQPLP